MNHPHTATSQLLHPQHDELPDRLKFFASAVTLNSTLWNNLDNVAEFFQKQGHKSYYVETLCAYIKSLHDTMYLFQKHVLNCAQLNGENAVPITYSLDTFQNLIFLRIMNFLQCRDDYYTSNHPYTDSDDEDEETNSLQNEDLFTNAVTSNNETPWRKFILISG